MAGLKTSRNFFGSFTLSNLYFGKFVSDKSSSNNRVIDYIIPVGIGKLVIEVVSGWLTLSATVCQILRLAPGVTFAKNRLGVDDVRMLGMSGFAGFGCTSKEGVA